MDWEYPANREGSRPSDKQMFTVLLKVGVHFNFCKFNFEDIILSRNSETLLDPICYSLLLWELEGQLLTRLMRLPRSLRKK